MRLPAALHALLDDIVRVIDADEPLLCGCTEHAISIECAWHPALEIAPG
jgi:hypothetical protein